MNNIPINAIPKIHRVIETHMMHLPQHLIMIRKTNDKIIAERAAPTKTIHPSRRSVAQALKTLELNCWNISTLLILVEGKQ